MTNDELAAIIDGQLNNAEQVGTGLDQDQGDAYDYYYGRPYGNEVEGRSHVVTRDLLEQIEWVMPQLMGIFISGHAVKFEPDGPEDIDQAEQETRAVQAAFEKDNVPYNVFNAWFRDSLLSKVGYVKIYWDEENTATYQTLRGLSDFDLANVAQDENVDILEHTEIKSVVVDDSGLQIEQSLHDIRIRITETRKKLVVDPVPPEEMRVSRRARSIDLDESPFVAHVQERTISDLIQDGYDKKILEALPKAYQTDQDDIGVLDTSRDQYAEQYGEEEADESQRLVEIEECYLYFDDDGDGISELFRVVKAGKEILEKEPVDFCPFAALTPIQIPHEHVGLGLGDLVMDIQLNKSVLLRQILDNLYLTNNPEKEVVEDDVELSDLLVSQPGGIKRVKRAGSIRELTVPFTAAASIPMLRELDTMKEARTGISRHTMGLDPDALAQSTKGAFFGAMNRAGIRVEDIARNFAETGIKQLFAKIHRMLSTDYEGSLVYRRGAKEWETVDPSSWKQRRDLTVVVGLGTGDQAQRTEFLMMVAKKQEEHILARSPMVTPENLYNTYKEIIELSDLKDPTKYFTDPATDPATVPPPPAPPEESDQVKIAKLQFQIEQAKLEQKQIELQLKERKQALDEVKTGADIATERTEQELKYGADVPGAVV